MTGRTYLLNTQTLPNFILAPRPPISTYLLLSDYILLSCSTLFLMSSQEYCPACSKPLIRKPSEIFRFCGSCRIELYPFTDPIQTTLSPTETPQTIIVPSSFALLKSGGAADVVNAARQSGTRKPRLEIRGLSLSQASSSSFLSPPPRFVRKVQLIHGPAGQLVSNIRKFKPMPGTDLWYPTDILLDQDVYPDEFSWTQLLWNMLIESNLIIWKEFTRHQWKTFGQGTFILFYLFYLFNC